MPKKTTQEISQKAQEIWDKLSTPERHYIGMGEFPEERMQQAVDQGFDAEDITTALLNIHETRKRRPAAPAKKAKRRNGKWRGK